MNSEGRSWWCLRSLSWNVIECVHVDTCSLLVAVPISELAALETCGLMLLLSPQAQYLPHLRVLKNFNTGCCLFFCLLLCFDLKVFLKYLNGKSIDLCFCYFSFHSVSFSYLPHPPLSFLPFPSPTPLLKYREGVCNFGLNKVSWAHAAWSFCYQLLHTLQRSLWLPPQSPLSWILLWNSLLCFGCCMSLQTNA